MSDEFIRLCVCALSLIKAGEIVHLWGYNKSGFLEWGDLLSVELFCGYGEQRSLSQSTQAITLLKAKPSSRNCALL